MEFLKKVIEGYINNVLLRGEQYSREKILSAKNRK